MTIATVLDGPWKHSYINGERYNISWITQIDLGGVWKAQILVTGVDWKTHSDFHWLTGGFGLDVTGFCAVGILTALSCFIVLGLFYTRSGFGDAVGMITAVGIGVLYLYLMMAL